MASSCEHIISRNLLCPVCLELYSDPKLLTCGHTFCKKCLSAILACSSETTASSLTCPICRSTTLIQNGEVVNLNTNPTIKSLIDDVRDSQQLCDICDTSSIATYYCYECGENMCNACLEKHNNWPPHLEHRVVSVEEIKKGKVVLEKEVNCPNHPSRVCTDVCISCKKFICEMCRFIDHKDHTVQSAEEYNASTKTQIESLQARGKTKATTVRNHQTCIESQRKRVDDHIDGKKAKINKIRQESIKQWAALDTQLERQRVKLCKRLDEMKGADERLITSIESASLLAGDSLKGPLEGNTICMHGSLSGEFENVLGRDDPNRKHVTDVGDRAEQLIFTQNIELDQLGIGEVRFLTCKLECDVKLENNSMNMMNFMAATPDGRMAVGYSSGRIDFFSDEGQLQQKVLMNVGILKQVAFLSDGRYVVHGAANTITLYTSEQTNLEVTFKTLGHEGEDLTDLTVDSNDLIYISYRKEKKIQVFSPNGGSAIREIPCTDWLPHLYKPFHITSYNDLLIITGLKTVRMVDQEGKVKDWFQKPGHPYVAVTKNNSILIAWVRHNDKLVSIDEYTWSDKFIPVRPIISDHMIEKPARCWYYLQVFPSGEIALCTPDKLYIFN